MTEQDSSSSQSTSQSHSTFKPQPGEDGSNMKAVEDHGNPGLSSGLFGGFPAQNSDYRPSAVLNSSGVSCIPYTYVDPYYGGFISTYGAAHSFTDPQMAADGAAIVPARVPLPIELAEAEPVYVNAKQYHRILRRRQLRAKLEAQNKLVKERKPYLHESRHLHAVKRARGSGGRFLNTKAQEGNSGEQNREAVDRENPGNSSNSTCSDTTSASNSDVFRPKDGGSAAVEVAAPRRVSFAR